MQGEALGESVTHSHALSALLILSPTLANIFQGREQLTYIWLFVYMQRKALGESATHSHALSTLLIISPTFGNAFWETAVVVI